MKPPLGGFTKIKTNSSKMGLVRDVVWTLLLATVFISNGIASIIVYSFNSNVTCGINGLPTLTRWVLGTGISYTLIGVMYIITTITFLLYERYKRHLPFLNMYVWQANTNIFALFSIPWTCVGINSCFCQGLDCATTNTPIWVMAVVNILLFTAFVPFAITFHSAVNYIDMKETKNEEFPHSQV